jgi:hypothetical protein
LAVRTATAISLAGLLSILATATARAEPADAARAKSAVFAEFVGAGFGYMLNYDRLVRPWLSLRGGLGYSASTGIGSGEYGNVALSASGVYSLGGAHHLELSPGFGLLEELGGDRSAKVLSLLGGYRYQPHGGGFFGRVQLGAAILSRSDKDAKTIGLFGLALGWSF